jgi:hypothetical protein
MLVGLAISIVCVCIFRTTDEGKKNINTYIYMWIITS